MKNVRKSYTDTVQEHDHLPAMPSRPMIAWIVLGYFAATFLVYGVILKNAFVAWDDNFLIVSNALIRGFSWQHLKDAFTSFDPELYDPLTMLSYMLDYTLGGPHPFMFHFTNLVLHTLNAICVAWLLVLLSRRQWIGVVGGLLFTLHPVNVEAVAWAAARKDVLSTFFFLSSIIAYLYYQRVMVSPSNHDTRVALRRACLPTDGLRMTQKILYVASIVLFLLGLISKVMVLTLPIVLLLIDYLQKRVWSTKIVTEKIPYVALSTIFGLVALFGKRGIAAQSTLPEKMLMAGKSTIYYLKSLFFPTHLSVLYPYTKPITIASPDFYLPALIVLVFIGLAVWMYKSNRAITFGIAFYLLTLAPTYYNFAKGGRFYFASDRYTYIPEIGIFLIVLTLIDLWLQRSGSIVKKTSFFGFLGLLGFLGVLTRAQALTWRNTETLFLHTLAYYPEALDGRINLGYVYRDSGLTNKALDQFNEVLRVEPNNALAFTNIGVVYEEQGRMDDAIAEFKKGMAADPHRQDAFLALGILYEKLGRLDDALAQYNMVQRMSPGFPDVYNNLGSIYAQKGDWNAAEASYRTTITINPYNADAHFNIASIEQKNGNLDAAAKEYERTLQLEGENVPTLQLLAGVYADLNNTDATVRTLHRMVAIDPQNTFATKLLDALRTNGLAK